MKIREVSACLEQWAPPAYQESYDNVGLLVGDPAAEVTGILVSLDATEAVIDEAVQKGCNLVVAHHPILFRGLKKLNGRNYVERAVIKAIKSDVALYAAHTNLDNVAGGVNYGIAARLGLENVHILAPRQNVLMKLVSFVPVADTQRVLDALYAAGAGQIGRYSHCSFRVEGTGAFTPEEGAEPAVGEVGRDEEVRENRVELIFPAGQETRMIAALRSAHPYEEVAYYLTLLTNEHQEVGSGAIGDLPRELDEPTFLAHLKKTMNLPLIRHTPLRRRPIRRVAVCGGAGSFLLSDALRAGADVLVTADYKYHEFFDADGRIIIADIGHYESEVFTKDLIQQHLLKKFRNFAVILSETVTNPVHYYI